MDTVELDDGRGGWGCCIYCVCERESVREIVLFVCAYEREIDRDTGIMLCACVWVRRGGSEV